MAHPYETVAIHYPSIPILETNTPLDAGTLIQGDEFDTVDLLRTFRMSGGHSSGTEYEYNHPQASAATTRQVAPTGLYFLDFHIYAEAANGLACPGVLTLVTWDINPATGDALTANRGLKQINYNGPGLGSPIFSMVSGLNGSIRCSGRGIAARYHNNIDDDQAVFQMGVFLRAA